MGINANSAFAAAVRNTDGRTFPRHPRRECTHLVQSYPRVITDSPFCRSASDVVLYTVTLKHANRPVVHLDRDRDDQLPLGGNEYSPHAGVEPDQIGCN